MGMVEIVKLAIFVVVVLLSLLALVLFVGRMLARPEICPKCGKRALRSKQALRMTVECNGKRAPDYLVYYECDACRSRFKRHIGRPYETPTDEEWSQYGHW